MESCIEVMESVLKDLSAGRAVQSLRQVLPLQNNNLIGLMPGYLQNDQVAGAKLISVFPSNHGSNFPSHQGLVTLFDASTGVLKAVVNGQKITAIRTAAVSAVATRYLAGEGAEVLAILGTGEQAQSHLEAMLLVRPIREVRVWSRSAAKAIQFQKEMSRKYDVAIIAIESVQEAVRTADIICTVTASTEPILKGEWLKQGVHINAIGACRAADRELDSETVRLAKLYVDRMESAHHESGDYLIPLKEGVITPSHIIGEMGELISGRIDGRTAADEITLFKGLGLAIEDLAAANYIYNEANRLNRGTEIDF